MNYNEILNIIKHKQQVMSRNVTVDIYLVDKKVITIAKMHDDYHDMKLATIFKKGTYKIVDIDAQMERTPYPICWNSTEIYKDLIGISAFEKGVLKKIRTIISRRSACTHITEMLEATLRSLFASLESLEGALFKKGLTPLEHQQVVMQLPGLKNSCLAFNEENLDEKLLKQGQDKLRE